MAAPLGIYTTLTSAELSALRTQLETARTAILTANQSVSRSGVSYTRADLKTILDDLREVYFAQAQQGGTVPTTTFAELT